MTITATIRKTAVAIAAAAAFAAPAQADAANAYTGMTTVNSGTLTVGAHTAVAGDWNSDGRTDIGTFDPASTRRVNTSAAFFLSVE